MPEPALSLVNTRPDQREQLAGLIAVAQAAQDPVRIRVSLSVYDPSGGRNYRDIRDAAWNLAMDSPSATPEHVQAVIGVLETCMNKLGEVGVGVVQGVLDQLASLPLAEQTPMLPSVEQEG